MGFSVADAVDCAFVKILNVLNHNIYTNNRILLFHMNGLINSQIPNMF